MKLEKIRKTLSDAVLQEMDAMKPDALKDAIAQGEEAVNEAKRELDKNIQYETACQAVADLSQGMKDVRAYQGAKIQYALIRLRETGNGKTLDAEFLDDLARLRSKIKG